MVKVINLGPGPSGLVEVLYGDANVGTKIYEPYEKTSNILDVINSIPQQPQVQYSLMEQLEQLRLAANKLGLYDAADYLKFDKK